MAFEGIRGRKPTDETYTRFQRALLFFSTTRRKTAAVMVVIAIWLGLALLGIRTTGFLYLAIAVLAVLFTQGALLRRPTKLPPDIMLRHATSRFTQKRAWQSTKNKDQVITDLNTVFARPGISVRTVGDSVWIEMDKHWNPGDLRHSSAAQHLKIKPPVHFFAETKEDGSTITAFSHDNRLTGMWDVMQLSDEMADAAVQLAKDATS